MQDYLIALLDWCKIKVFLWNRPSKVLFKEGEIWWCSIGMNVGVEIFGKGQELMRPVLIFKKFNTDLFFGIPLTSKKKEGSWYVPVIYGQKESKAILNQARTLDRKRLMKRIGTLSSDSFIQIKTAFLDFYGS